ncbi:MAG: type B 50S ribosomal protein L31 [Acidobacteria bacterium]|nr:type B 50S ribosomal protein L31 [Acidobacteriota bacterium]MDA1233313.1 type B 50S ribosomal protein L31 [Acidobacteriota bacterium]
MKEGIHPKAYRDVVFRDITTSEEWLGRSTVKCDKKTTFEGTEYPLCDLPISSLSHPFYTGRQKLVDTEGRVERFRKKFGTREERDQAKS